MRMDDVALECMMGEAVEIVPYFNNVHLAVVAGLNGGNVLTSLVFLVKHWLQELGKPRLSVRLSQRMYWWCRSVCSRK